MAKFIPYDYNQNSMIVINYQDQLVPGTFEYAVHKNKQDTQSKEVFSIAIKQPGLQI